MMICGRGPQSAAVNCLGQRAHVLAVQPNPPGDEIVMEL